MATNPTIKPRRGTAAPGTGAINQNELAVDTTNKRIYIGAADGSGTLIGSAPGGSDTQVQFNDGGNLGGDSGLTYNKTTDALTVSGEVFVNGGALRTTQTSFNIVNTTATTVNMGGSATSISMGSASCTTTIGGGTLVGTTTSQSVFNTVATSLSIGGSSSSITIGSTTGTTSIRNSNLRLGNTVANILTNSGSSNDLSILPFGRILLAPDSSASVGGSFPSLTVENTDQASGVVEISGGNLYLGRKTVDDIAYTAVGIVFEGATANASDTTLTVEDPTAARTITLPDATGTVGLLGTGSTTDGRIPYYDTTTKTFLGASSLLFNDATSTFTFDGTVNIGATLGTSNSTVNLLNTVATTINFGGASSSTINIGSSTGNSTIDIQNNILKQIEMRDYFESEGTVTYTGGMTQDLAVDLNTGNVFVYTTVGSITTITVNNVSAKANVAVGFTLVITCGNALYSVNFDTFSVGSPVWAGGTPPTASNTANRTDIVSFVTYDGGTTWYGMTGGLNFF